MPHRLLVNILAPETKTMLRIKTHAITLTIETTLSPAGLRVMAEELAKLAETVPSAAHAMTYRSMSGALTEQAKATDDAERDEWEKAEITGDRSTHPRHGAQSDIMVKFSNRPEAGPFAYYADAYRHAVESGIEPRYITRNGSKARAA